jgi:Protein phosphatase 2C
VDSGVIFMSAAPWRIVGASVVGSSHISGGIPCQDFSLHTLIEAEVGQVLVAVVSDGAGTAKEASAGSYTACNTFIALVQAFIAEGGRVSSIDRTRVEHWIKTIADTLERTAQQSGHHVREYACTLLAAVVADDASVFLQIGDGAIVTSHGEEDGWSWVFWPQHGEFANTTNFVVSEDALEVLEVDHAPRRIDEIALFTDGIENLVLHRGTKTVHVPFFNALLKPIRGSANIGYDESLSEKLGAYLGSPAFSERTDDDRTLLIASRKLCQMREPL